LELFIIKNGWKYTIVKNNQLVGMRKIIMYFHITMSTFIIGI